MVRITQLVRHSGSTDRPIRVRVRRSGSTDRPIRVRVRAQLEQLTGQHGIQYTDAPLTH